MNPKENAVAPTKNVKIQKMITAGSTHYTCWGCGRDEDRDRDSDGDQNVAQAVRFRHWIERDPVPEKVEIGTGTHHGVLPERASAEQRPGDLRRHRHAASIGRNHDPIER